MGQVWIDCDAPVTVTVPGHVRKSSAGLQPFLSRRSRSAEASRHGDCPRTRPGRASAGGARPFALGAAVRGARAAGVRAARRAGHGSTAGRSGSRSRGCSRTSSRRSTGSSRSRRCPRRTSSSPAGAQPTGSCSGCSAPARRARDRLGNAGRLAEIDLDGRAGLPAGRSGVRRAAAAARAARREPEVAVLIRQRPHRPRRTRRSPPGAIVLTTDAGAARLAGRLPDGAIVALGPRPSIRPRGRRAARARGHRLILSEGGPHAIGAVPRGRPRRRALPHHLAAPRRTARRRRPGSRSSRAPTCSRAARSPRGCLGVRRDGDHLFLRYRARHVPAVNRLADLHPARRIGPAAMGRPPAPRCR